MLKWLDVPPVWLGLCLVLAGALRDMPPVVSELVWDRVGQGLILLGLALMVWAAVTMIRARTTVIPHQQPDALVTSGPFRCSRNPIYLGDALVLTGAVLWWGNLLALILVPVFMAVISWRFIRPEESRLREGFGDSFDTWSHQVRRWV
ncbi:methyltransferase family protein [Palleronia caenipelagi]|uniref:Isoprenylcysteine carboxylmethyltransferase family protein n=1 Tax=Palleronia caenipelagi TaxID=2489174 RepID=A0A547QAW5_9RHOB|nr:isoprenylcysteine carboxylmethyltransferase family protein [Palleronia caenipelagi]TRD23541.1 isoprenylcysteine carboxylmethyltransferase family protein [Palleronia caenipelagi]